ncbi:hypothetical protein BC939DRAFT_479362 [Gamsiella multidivaricata]|uniref:uncharacterized protein n=1 Tax=Gamsiella multidivaricata TaxID=101098 RepID=UPI002220AE74|nr:uncharacterized protein BC939DRAFT_479362 [Gamsiella multidivaricata]KAI7819848.1 hypothetical protein BC939DRAFT_479362 [Gamsiella multidivaricata]
MLHNSTLRSAQEEESDLASSDMKWSHDSDSESFKTVNSLYIDIKDEDNVEASENIKRHDKSSQSSQGEEKDVNKQPEKVAPLFTVMETRLSDRQQALGTWLQGSASHEAISGLQVQTDLSYSSGENTTDTPEMIDEPSVSREARTSWFHPSLTEAAIRAAAPFFSQWLPAQNNSTTVTAAAMGPQILDTSTLHTESVILDSAEQPLPEVHLRETRGRSVHRMGTSEIDKDPSQPLEADAPELPSPSWYRHHSRFLPSVYQSTIAGSWYNSMIVSPNTSLISRQNQVRPDDSRVEEDTAAGFSHRGSAAVGRFTELVVFTGQATLDYLTDTIAPAAVNVVHRGTSSTIDFLSTQLQAVPQLFSGLVRESSKYQSTSHSANEGTGTAEEGSHDNETENVTQRSRSAPIMLSTTLGAEGRSVTRPAAGATAAPRHRSTDTYILAMTGTKKDSEDTAPPSHITKQSRPGRRRYPLQAFPGPENLDSEIRRQLEAEGLASLDLCHEGKRRCKERSWWDPRRYGLPKYIVWSAFRRPRPCTMILLMILVVCIVLPVVLRN